MPVTSYTQDPNEKFSDPDAVIPGVSDPVSQLPPSSSLTSEHIQLHPSSADVSNATARLSVSDTRSSSVSHPYGSFNSSAHSLNAPPPSAAPQAPLQGTTVTTTTTTTTTAPAPASVAPQPIPGAFPTAFASGVASERSASGATASANVSAHGSVNNGVQSGNAGGANASANANGGSGNAAPNAPNGSTAHPPHGTPVLGANAQNKTPAPAKATILRRKLTSFVGFSNLPQQWHQKSIREGFDLNLLVIGDSGLGKSTLLNTLFEVPVHDLEAPHQYDNEKSGVVGISTTKIELNESGVRLRLSVVDTPGYGDHINNYESWKSISDEVDARFDQYLESEESLSAGAGSAAGAAGAMKDPRIHACLFFIEPTGHSLKPLDVVVMKKLHKKVNLVPVIAKADTQTEEELAEFKKLVLAELRAQDIEVFEPPTYDFDDEETVSELQDLKARVPFAVIGSTSLVVNGQGHSVLGREYPWGVVEVMNEDHCDFVKLRSLLIRNHMEDLHERTNALYEKYRTEKLLKMGVKQDDSVFDQPDPAVRQEEERRLHEQRLAKMEEEMRAVFQQKVTEKETKLKSSENELFQKHREIQQQLSQRFRELTQRKQELQAQIESKSRKMIR